MVESVVVDWLILRLVDLGKMEVVPFLPATSNLTPPSVEDPLLSFQP